MRTRSLTLLALFCLGLAGCGATTTPSDDAGATSDPADAATPASDASSAADTGSANPSPDAATAGPDAGQATDAGACPTGQTPCGTACCASGETCNAATSTCTAQNQLQRCYAQASFPGTAFASKTRYLVDEEGYEYEANHEVDTPYAQSISVAIYPASASTHLVGTFDLAAEPFDYGKCERCVLVTASRTETDQKRYLAKAGTLTTTEVTNQKITGSLKDVKLVEVQIDDKTFATKLVPGGCELSLPALSFKYAPAVVDPRITQCFLPESFAPTQFVDFIQEYTVNDSGWFYRAMELPAAPGIPALELFIEVYEEGTGTFGLAGAETNCATCMHMVIIEAKATSGKVKSYVSSGGNLVLTQFSDTLMVGRLENVTLVETNIQDSTFTPVPGGCSTRIDSLAFDSRNETK